ncbi:MAG: 4-coumarate--CoA ligase family protein [Acidimicrobiia bacterium]
MIVTSPYPDVTIPDTDITSYVLRQAEELGDKPALIDGPTGRTITFGGLAKGIESVAAGLAARGFAKGDVFAIYCPNVPEFAVAFHAVARLGGVNTTINPLYTAEELTLQLNDAGARFLLTIPQFLDKAAAAARNSGIEEVFVLGEAAGATPFADLMAEGPAPEVAIDPQDVVVLPYSSGTTGLPKGVMLTHHNLVANIQQCGPALTVDSSDTIIAVLPFFHIYGMQVIMNMAVSFGATVVTMPRFDMEQFLGLMQDHKVTNAYLVPPIVLGLAKLPLVDDYDLSSLRLIMSGAAPLGADLQNACAERLGCTVMQGYGLTETSPVTHVVPPDSDDARPGSIGPPLPKTECRIVDPVTEQDMGVGEPGELWMRGPQVMKGYLNNPEATAACIDEGGWFHSGDIATVDSDGWFTIVDRLKELIKYKGMQVAPAELEALLLSNPAIADVAVIASPDEEAGEVPKAFVVLRSETTPTEIMDWVADRVAPHKKIRRLEIVDEIPKSASGKILRRILVEKERAATGSL